MWRNQHCPNAALAMVAKVHSSCSMLFTTATHQPPNKRSIAINPRMHLEPADGLMLQKSAQDMQSTAARVCDQTKNATTRRAIWWCSAQAELWINA
jgi:hypothetical protein